MKHLEPVVKKNTSYSILFLRDDSSVVRFRLKPFWINFLTVVFFLFSGASGAAGYAAHYYWKRYNVLKHENRTIEARYEESARKLAAYTGVEMLKESTALPRSSMAGVSALTANGNANGAHGQNGNGQATGSGPPTAPHAAPSAASAGQSGASQGQETGKTQAVAEPAPGNSTGAAAGVSQGFPSQEQTGSPSGTADSEHPALVSEVVVRPDGSKNFSLAFDLSNRDQQLTLNGRVELAVGTKSGARHEITQVNRNALRFIINRYKRVNTSFTLPTDLKPEDITELLLTVTAEDQPDVTYSFPIPSPS